MNSLKYLRGDKQISDLKKEPIERRHKKNITFSVNIELVKKLRKYCKEEGMFVSSVVERAIKKFIDTHNDK